MKILMTCTGSWGTGSFTVVDALVKEYLKAGHNVKVFFPDTGLKSNDSRAYYDQPDLYHIWSFPIENAQTKLDTFPLMIPDPHPRNPKSLTFKSLSDAQLQLYFTELEKALTQTIDQFKPDVIECQHIWSTDYVLHKLGHPYISVAHHSDQLGYHYDPRMQKYANIAAEHASYIFAISPHVRQNVIELYNVPEEKVITMGNGYDHDIFKPMPVDRKSFLNAHQLTLPKNATLVTFSGKLSHTKGIDTLIQANEILSTQTKRPIHFLIFGAGDANEWIKNHQHTDRLHFLGHQTQDIVAQAHNISDFTIMPSRTEGFGLACLEAMACGLPAIVTRSGGPEHYAVGRIVDKEAPKQLAEAILEIANLPSEEYRALSHAARQKAREFSWKTIAEQRLHYYNKIASHLKHNEEFL